MHWAHLKPLFAVIQLHVQAMGSVPVPVDDVRLSVAVEVGQSDSSAVLHRVLDACKRYGAL